MHLLTNKRGAFPRDSRAADKLTPDRLAATLMKRYGCLSGECTGSDLAKEAHSQRMEFAEKYQGWTALDYFRAACRLDGINQPDEPGELIRAATSGGTSPSVFVTSHNAALQVGFDSGPDSTRGWTGESDKKDFLQAEVNRLDAIAQLQRLPRGGAAEHITTDAVSENYNLSRYAAQVLFAEQDIINDHIDIYGQRFKDIGRAAARLRPDLVYSILLANANMRDAVALFAAGHSNDSALAFSAANLQAALAAMRLHRENDVPLNIRGRYLIVSPALQYDARKVLRETLLTGHGDDDVLCRLRVDDRLSASGGVTDPVSGTKHSGSDTT